MVKAQFEQKALVQNGAMRLARPLSELKIPPTVQAVLASRIDRLPATEKELLQILAVIGKQFPPALVRSVSRRPDREVSGMLQNLHFADFIYGHSALPDTEYIFKHSLTQEVSYLERGRKLVSREHGDLFPELREQRWSKEAIEKLPAK